MPLKLQLQLQLCMIQLTFFSLKNPVLKCYVSVYTCVLYGGGAPSCVLILLKHCLLSGDMGGRILGQPRPLGFVTPIRTSPINPKSKIKTLFKFLKGIFFSSRSSTKSSGSDYNSKCPVEGDTGWQKQSHRDRIMELLSGSIHLNYLHTSTLTLLSCKFFSSFKINFLEKCKDTLF